VGSIGYIVMSAGIGLRAGALRLHSMFAFYALIMSTLVIAAARLPHQPVRIASFSLGGLGVMLRQPPWLVFMASLFLLGTGFAGIATS